MSTRLQIQGKRIHNLILYENQTSESGKLNGVGKIFPDCFNLNKYSLITTIHFIINDVEASRSFTLIDLRNVESIID